jgi:hypothetical protein
MATPAPKPGTNGSGRTPAEQVDFQRYQNSKNIGKGSDPSLLETFVKGMFKPAPSRVVAPSKKQEVASKKAALKKPVFKIPASKFH